MSRARAALVVALAVSSLVQGSAQAAPAQPSPAAAKEPRRPRLVLFVSVDQMRFDYLTRFGPLFEGGFKRLLAEGAVFGSARYRHANCETGPGHSVLLSGRNARDTGIVANSWYDRTLGRSINVVEDPAHTALPGPGRAASPANFIGVTVGDLLKKASPSSRVVGVSLKDRSAILMAGRRADAAYWYEPAAGRFGTSTYYMKMLPEWLLAWSGAGHLDRLAGRFWDRLRPDPALYARYAGPDDVRGEWDNVDTVFPHRVRGAPPSKEFYDDLRRTPFADELTLEVALQAAAAHDLGTDEATDILAVGFSATDVIGHTYGPDSQEALDQLLRLDRTLGRLLEAMEVRAGGRDRVLFGLSADHGVMPLVETLIAQGKPAQRVHPDLLEHKVKEALAARFPGATDLLADFDEANFTLDLDAVARRGLKRADVEDTARAALMAMGIVDRVYTHADLLADAPAGDPFFPLHRASFFESRSPHVITRLKPYVYVDDYIAGTGHGTPQDYDRHVPVAFLGAGVKAGRYDQETGPEDIAPTLCRILRLPYRLGTGQRVLTEMLSSEAGP